MKKQTIDALKWIIDILNMHHIRYQLAGGFAARLYGAPRDLNDIDIDVADSSIAVLLPSIGSYSTFGPAHFHDGKWDMKLITLDYSGQEIDIGEIDTIKISTKDRAEWIPYPNDLSRCLPMTFEGLDVFVQHPRDLASYKKELDGDHQRLDIDAAEAYAAMHGL